MRAFSAIVTGAALFGSSEAVTLRSTMHMNPIRKVVMLLQKMQSKIEDEKKTQTGLYEKFVCYCKNGAKELDGSIAELQQKIPQLQTDIKAAEEEKAQLQSALKEAQSDRTAAKSAMKQATGIREKDASAFASEKQEADSNIASIKAAVQALEKGMAGTFLQTRAATNLRNVVQSKQDMMEEDRNDIMAFLSNTEDSEYAPSSGQITGILKTMGDEMEKGLADATNEENSAISDFGSLMSAKKKEVVALTKSIETKMTRIGELSVSVTQMKNDLEDSSDQLGEDEKFLANLGTDCKKRAAEWEVREKKRGEELLAIAETIKVLNDDDALELFKKTLPSAASSFLQVGVTSKALRAKALAKIKDARATARHGHRAQLDTLLLAIRGKKIGFDKIISMIDQMVVTLKTEQTDDDSKRSYCAKELDSSDDKKKALEKSISDGEAAIASTKDGIQNVIEEMKELTAGIKALDKSVAEATEQRKEENSNYKELMASDSAAKELLGFAKNRLNKFYNPRLYKAAPKAELSTENRIFSAEGGDLSTPAPGGIAGTGISFAQVTSKAHQPGIGEYKEKSQENSGVISMMNVLIADLDREMTEAEVEEKNAQQDYEQLMKDSQEKRATDSKSLTEKSSAKASMEQELEESKANKASDTKQLGATNKYIMQIHGECDWLMKYYDVRKTARASEVDALSNAKAVLSGADYSF